MFFPKVFVALAAIVVAAASPVKRAASCSNALTPTMVVSGDLTTDFNYALGHALAIETGSINVGTGILASCAFEQSSVGSALAAEGLTDIEIAAIINWLAGETLQGRTAD